MNIAQFLAVVGGVIAGGCIGAVVVAVMAKIFIVTLNLLDDWF